MMSPYYLSAIIILTACRSVELKQSVPYFHPIAVHLGADISIVARQLNIDTTMYSMAGYARHLKKYGLKRSNLDNLNFHNNYADSMSLYFYKNRLFTIDIHASENHKVEYLKFEIPEGKERSLGMGGYVTNDATFSYGKYRELRYRSWDRHIRYEYSEDIIDNTATLTIVNEKMLKTMPPRGYLH